MSRRNGCSHCRKKGHTKPNCPDKHRSHDDLVEETRAKDREYFATANAVADVLAKFDPDTRARLTLEAFRRSETRYMHTVWDPLREREAAALEQIKAQIDEYGRPKLRVVR